MCNRAQYLQYCGSYAPQRGHRTQDATPTALYYKLTGELKIFKKHASPSFSEKSLQNI